MILLGGLLVLVGLFASGDTGDASLMGVHLGATAVFIAGALAAVLVLLGILITRWGARSEWRRRKERKGYEAMAEQFEKESRDGD